MHDSDLKVGAAAVRAVVNESADKTSPSAQRCIQRIEHLLFEGRALAPAEAISHRVMQVLRKDSEVLTLDDHALLKRHDELCVRLAADFAKNADNWQDRSALEFRSGAARVFGVEESNLVALFREFHALSEPQRLGIFLAIEEAPLFSYLTDEIDGYEGEAKVDNPTASLRSLLASVFATE